MHRNATASQTDNLARCPAENGKHAENCEDGQDNNGCRVLLGEFPEAEHDHLWVSDEHDTEQDTLQNSGPAISEILKLLTLHAASSDQQLADSFENADSKNHEDNEGEEEDIACHENVGRLDTRTKANTLNAPNSDSSGRVREGRISVGALEN